MFSHHCHKTGQQNLSRITQSSTLHIYLKVSHFAGCKSQKRRTFTHIHVKYKILEHPNKTKSSNPGVTGLSCPSHTNDNLINSFSSTNHFGGKDGTERERDGAKTVRVKLLRSHWLVFTTSLHQEWCIYILLASFRTYLWDLQS